MINSDGTKDELYYLTREEARRAARFYKTMCDPPQKEVKIIDMEWSRNA